MSDPLAAFNVLEVRVTAGLPGPPGTNGSPGQQGAPGDPDTPYFAAGATTARNSIVRASDAISIKDDALGSGVDETAPITAWIARLNATYTHGTSPNVLATSRAGFIPGGLWDGNQTLSTNAFGYSLFGQGRVSQLQDVTFQVLNSSVRAGNFAIIGSGAAAGTGVDLRSIQFLGVGIDIYNKDIAVDNSQAAVAGGFGSNNTLIGGWYRGGRIGVSSAGNDLRLCFLRGADFTECGIDRWDAGGVHFIGNNFNTDFGPSLRLRGKSYSFTGDIIEGDPVVTNVSDFSQITVGDVVGSLALGGDTLPNTRIDSFDEMAGTVTLNLPAQNTDTGVTITINQVPVEDFYVDNTFNSGRQDLIERTIVSITDASGNIRVTLATPHWGLSLGDDGLSITGSSNSAYNITTGSNTRVITAIENWNTVVISMPYVGDATGGTLKAQNFDVEILSAGTSNAFVRDQFFVGNNMNRTLFQGGADINAIGTRFKTSMWFDGVRPFHGDTSIGNDQITNINIPTSEIRVGLPLTFVPASFASEVVSVISIDDPTTITVSEAATSANVSALIRSPYTPAKIWHIPVVDSDTIAQVGVTVPSGPGATVGWGQACLFPVGTNPGYIAAEGDYFVGFRCPHTAGGMANGQAAHLNELGVMNTGLHIRSNTARHMLQGDLWKSSTNILTLTDNDININGIVGNNTGADVSFNVMAHRSGTTAAPGSVYGNAIQRFYAPKNSTAGAGTAVVGYLVAPGNDPDDQGNFFIGASLSGAPDLTGDRAALRSLASSIELRSDNVLSGWNSGAEWFRLSSTTTSFLSESLNNIKLFHVSNANAGTLATAAVSVTQTGSQNVGVSMQVYGTGFTPVGTHDLADGAAVYSGAGLSMGLTVAALAGNLRLSAAGEIIGDFPTSDPGVPGAIWCDTGAGRVLKMSA